MREIEAADAASAMPKSATLASPPSARSTFWGFTSRWITPRPWAALKAPAIWVANPVASSNPSGPSALTRSFKVPPGTYSITM